MFAPDARIVKSATEKELHDTFSDTVGPVNTESKQQTKPRVMYIWSLLEEQPPPPPPSLPPALAPATAQSHPPIKPAFPPGSHCAEVRPGMRDPGTR